MEEGVTHISKYTIDAQLVAPVTMVAACNPKGTYWKYPDKIEIDEIPLPPKEIDRYDLIFFLRMPREREQLKEFASDIKESDKKYLESMDNTFLNKVILYSKQFKPKLSDESIEKIEDYWIEVAIHRGSVRIKNVLERLTKGFAKLRFKSVADIQDANDAISLYKFVYSQYETIDYSNTIPKNPQYVSADVCAEILKKNPSVDKRVDDLILMACSQNPQVAAYFSGEKKIRTSYKAQTVRDILLQNPNVEQVGRNPVTLQWFEPLRQPTTTSDSNPATSLDNYTNKDSQINSPSNDIGNTQCYVCDVCEVDNVIPNHKVSDHDTKDISADIKQLIDSDIKEEFDSNDQHLISSSNHLYKNKSSIEDNKEENKYHSVSVKDSNYKKDQFDGLSSCQLPTSHSSHTSHSDDLSIENNYDFQNNNINPKQIRIQLHHSKAADIETNEDSDEQSEKENSIS